MRHIFSTWWISACETEEELKAVRPSIMDTPQESPNPGSKTKVITVLVVLLVVVTFVVIQLIRDAPTAGAGGKGPPAGGPPQMPPASVYAVPAEVELTREQVVVTGVIQSISKSDVAAQEEGVVLQILVKEGDEVKKGDPLALLDPRRLKAQLQEGKARLTSSENLHKQRQAELTRAETDLDMKQKLSASKAVSKSAVLDAEKAMTVASAQLKVATDGITEAKSRLDLLNIQQDDLTVKAPFDGIVVARHVETGEWVASGATVVTLVAVDPIEAWLRVPAKYLGRASTDTEDFKVRQSSTGRIFHPTKITYIPEVESRSQLYTAIASIPNVNRELTPGESITGIVPIGEKTEYLRLPVNAIVHSQRGTVIQIVQPPKGEQPLPTGKAVPISISFEREGHVFIDATDAGFKAGDQVIVEGNQRLIPGQSVIVKPKNQPGTPPQKPAK